MIRRLFVLSFLLTAVAACGKFPPSFRNGGTTADKPTFGSIKFVAVPASVYRIGSVESRPGQQAREVTSPGFLISATEVTEVQFGAGRSDRPAANVTLAEAQDFCRRTSEKFGRHVRLPTADEWEIAARGGIRGARYPWGWGDPTNRAVFATSQSRRVASHAPNGFGIYDMAGNVAEWCESTNEIACGGSWADRDANQLRVFSRNSFDAGYKGEDVGFRVLLENN